MEVLTRPIRFLLFFVLLLWGLYYSREVLIPFCFAGLLSMLFLSISRKLESKGISRGFAALCCIIIFLLVIAGIFALLGWQFADLAKDLTGIEQRIKGFIEDARKYISNTFGIDNEQQKKIIQKQQSSGGSQVPGMIGGFVGSFMSILVNFILVLVYFFLLLYFRTHIRKFVIKVTGARNQSNTNEIMNQASGVAQKYLTGMALMIGCLWVLYGIGFSVVGVKHAIFFAILCGLLEIIPFVGNITGTSLTVIATFAQGGDMNVIIGILIVYAIVQFLQTYILEPLVVGAEVNINPLFTILVIVIGESLWGVAGMILAIPLLGIVKIICDHVEPLKPYGFLIGEEKKKKSSGLRDKISKMFKK